MTRPPKAVLVLNEPTGVVAGGALSYRGLGQRCAYEGTEILTYRPSTTSNEMALLRIQKGLTLGCLARALGITVAQVSGAEGSSNYSEFGLTPESYSEICAWLRTLPDRDIDAVFLSDLEFDE
jgi:hypothetical protein